MMTVLFAYDLHSERQSEALLSDKRQGLSLMRSYKIRKSKKLCDIDT